MRFASAVVWLLFAGIFSSLAAAPLPVGRVWPEYRTAASFVRIREYFTGEENPGRETILRSQLAARAGYYFLVRLDNPEAPIAGAVFELKVILPTSATPKIFIFKTEIPTRSHAFEVGLTGDDWPSAKTNPVAWLLTVRGPDGTELAHQQSFLWALPDAGK